MRTTRSLALMVSPAVAATALTFTLGAVPQAAVTAGAAPLAPVAAPRAVSLAAATQWEYATVPLIRNATKQVLDTWGADGWELVTVLPDPDDPARLVAYFKRPVEPS